MAEKECKYYASAAEEDPEFIARFPPCSPDKATIDAFIEKLNALLATEPNAIDAHLKALQQSTGCFALRTNSEQRPSDLKGMIQNLRKMKECAAIKYLPKKVG
ncbi:hypothetical protein HY345_02940 [Candidatus Microgenomates bacterium]|nr:hypothetical protein [Candidatus Microgenomates bacterium]